MNGQFQIGQLSPWRYFLAIAVVLGLLFGLTASGPEASAGPLYLLQWMLQSLAAIASLVAIHIVLSRWGRFQRFGAWQQLIASGVVACLLASPLFLFLDVIAGQNELPRTAGGWVVALADEIAGFLPPVLLTWLAINAPFCLGYRFTTSTDAGVDIPVTEAPDRLMAVAPQPPFLAEIDGPDVGELLYLKAELHYIKVVTANGASLVLYNLKDAAAQLPEELGTVCHRSYWVAWSAISALQKSGRQGLLKMSNGDEVPVSRQHLKRLGEKLQTR